MVHILVAVYTKINALQKFIEIKKNYKNYKEYETGGELLHIFVRGVVVSYRKKLIFTFFNDYLLIMYNKISNINV
jgi:hypothetical protein